MVKNIVMNGHINSKEYKIIKLKKMKYCILHIFD
jgi:hypothetical protein